MHAQESVEFERVTQRFSECVPHRENQKSSQQLFSAKTLAPPVLLNRHLSVPQWQKRSDFPQIILTHFTHRWFWNFFKYYINLEKKKKKRHLSLYIHQSNLRKLHPKNHPYFNFILRCIPLPNQSGLLISRFYFHSYSN